MKLKTFTIVLFTVISQAFFHTAFADDNLSEAAKLAQIYKKQTTLIQEYADRRLIDKYNELAVEYPQYTPKQRAEMLSDNYLKYYNSAKSNIDCLQNNKCDSGVHATVDIGADLGGKYFGKYLPIAPGVSREIGGFIKSEYVDTWAQKNSAQYLQANRIIGVKEASSEDVYRSLSELGKNDPVFQGAYNKIRELYSPDSEFRLGMSLGDNEQKYLSKSEVQQIETAVHEVESLIKASTNNIDPVQLKQILDIKLRKISEDSKKLESQLIQNSEVNRKSLMEAIGKIEDRQIKAELLLRLQTEGAAATVNRLAEIEKSLQAQANEALDPANTSKQILQNLQPVIEYVSQQKIKEKEAQSRTAREAVYQARITEINNAEASARIFTAVLGLKDQQAAARINQVVSIVAQTAKMQSAYNLGAGVGAAALTGNYIMAGVQLSSLFSDAKESDSTEVILQAIQQLSRQVENLRKEMHDRFDMVDRRLDRMLDTLSTQMAQLQSGVSDLKVQSQKTIEELQKLEYYQAFFTHEILDATASAMRASLNTCSLALSWTKVPSSPNKIADCFNTALNWGMDVAYHPPFARIYDANLPLGEMLATFDSPENANLNSRVALSAKNYPFITSYLDKELGIASTNSKDPNLVELLRGYRMTAYMRANYPNATDLSQMESLHGTVIAINADIRKIPTPQNLNKILGSLQSDRTEIEKQIIRVIREQGRNSMDSHLTNDLLLNYKETASASPIQHCGKIDPTNFTDAMNSGAVLNQTITVPGLFAKLWGHQWFPNDIRRLVASGLVRWEPCFYVKTVSKFNADGLYSYYKEQHGHPNEFYRKGVIEYGFKNNLYLSNRSRNIILNALSINPNDKSPIAVAARKADAKELIAELSRPLAEFLDINPGTIKPPTPSVGMPYIAYPMLELGEEVLYSHIVDVLPVVPKLQNVSSVYIYVLASKNPIALKNDFFTPALNIDPSFLATQLDSAAHSMIDNPNEVQKYKYMTVAASVNSPRLKNKNPLMHFMTFANLAKDEMQFQWKSAVTGILSDVINHRAAHIKSTGALMAEENTLADLVARYEIKTQVIKSALYLSLANKIGNQDTVYSLMQNGSGLGEIAELRQIVDDPGFEIFMPSVTLTEDKPPVPLAYIPWNARSIFGSDSVSVLRSNLNLVTEDLWNEIISIGLSARFSAWGAGQPVLAEKLNLILQDPSDSLPFPLIEAERISFK